jgi:endo-1,4-beta-mannosidase
MRTLAPTTRCCVNDAEPGTFRLGVNYLPAETAMSWLQWYDAGATRRDFRRAASAGLDCLRVFLRWEDVQPTAGTIDTVILDRLVDAADAADETNVTLIVTLFVGHMSGVNYIPAWATGGSEGDRRFRVVSKGLAHTDAGIRNWYADRGIVAAQERLAAAAAGALSEHPAVWAWDLGNENSNCTVPPDTAAGEEWLERMTTVIRAHDPGRPITIGIHMEDLEEDRRIGPREAARWCDIVSMHGYPIYAGWSAGPTDDALLPFLAELTRWLSGGAPVLFEEFGLPTAAAPEPGSLCVSEAAAADYTGRALDGLRRSGCIGALLWCFADYAPSLHSAPPLDLASHERTFGLWHADGSPKPAVAELTARSGLARRLVTAPGAWLDIDEETFASDRRTHLARLYARYRADEPWDS